MANKAYVISDSLAFNLLGTPPSSPTLGEIYQDLSGKTFKWNGSSWVTLGSGVGGGTSKNYIEDPTFEDGAPGSPAAFWSAFNVSLDSNFHPTGAPTLSSSVVAQVVSTSANLTDNKGLRLTTSSTSVSGNGIISNAFTLDKAALAKAMIWAFNYMINPADDVGSLSGEITGSNRQTIGVYVYDVTASAWVVPVNFNGINTKGSGSNNLVGDIVGSFQSAMVAGQQYRLAIVFRNALPDAAVTIDFDDFFIGMSEVGQESRLLAALASNAAGGASISPSQPIDFETVVYDYGNAITTGSAWKYTAQESGIYSVSFFGAASPVADTRIYKNGALYALIGVFKTGADSTGSCDVQMNAGDYIDIRSGSSTTTSGGQRIAVHKIGQIQQSSSGRLIAASLSVETNSQNFTANVDTKVLWDNTFFDTSGSWDFANSKYIVPESGIYKFSGVLSLAPSGSGFATRTVYLKVNGTFIRANQTGDTANTTGLFSNGMSFDFNAKLNAGDVCEIWLNTFPGNTFDGNDPSRTQLNIQKLEGGAAAAVLNEKVYAKYRAPNGNNISPTQPLDFSSKVLDSHNAAITGSAWKYVAPVSGVYRVNTALYVGTALDIYVYKNGTAYEQIGAYQNGNQFTSSSTLVDLIAGEYIDIRSGTSQTTSSNISYVDIEKIS